MFCCNCAQVGCKNGRVETRRIGHTAPHCGAATADPCLRRRKHKPVVLPDATAAHIGRLEDLEPFMISVHFTGACLPVTTIHSVSGEQQGVDFDCFDARAQRNARAVGTLGTCGRSTRTQRKRPIWVSLNPPLLRSAYCAVVVAQGRGVERCRTFTSKARGLFGVNGGQVGFVRPTARAEPEGPHMGPVWGGRAVKLVESRSMPCPLLQ